MAKKYTPAERKSYKRGFLAGLFAQKKRKPKANKKEQKQYGFLAFNKNCDVFNVKAYGYSRTDALKNARNNLKHDPKHPYWSVTVTEDEADSNYYRNICISKNGSVSEYY